MHKYADQANQKTDHAIEKFKKNTEHLNNVELIEKAISFQSKTKVCFGVNYSKKSKLHRLGNSMSQVRSHQKLEDDYLVETVTLEEILQNNTTDAHLIKCDIEGGEEFVLSDFLRSCYTHKVNLWLSFHYTWWENKDISRFKQDFELAKQLIIFTGEEWLEVNKPAGLIQVIQQYPFSSILFVSKL